MTFKISDSARLASLQVNERPQVILAIDGVPTLYGTVNIEKVVQINDPGLYVGDDWVIGGLIAYGNQADYIKTDGTTTQISQTLNQDKGIGGSISTVSVTLIDKNSEISKLITPGQVVADVLGRRAKLYLGFQGTAYPDDYVILFRGVIDEIDSSPGNCTFVLVHPDRKKLQVIYPKCSPSLVGDITNSVTSITVDSTANMLQRILGPDGTYDTAAKFYVQIDDEVMSYTTITGNVISGIVRGQLGTAAAAHSDGAAVNTFYRLLDNVMKMALKVMLSGWGGPFKTGLSVTNFVYVDPTVGLIPNSMYFDGVDLAVDYGLTTGDYITTTLASNGANCVTLKPITDIVKTDLGSYMVIGGGVTFVEERATTGVTALRSQYDTYADGLQMYPDEVDIAEHLRLYRLFLSSFSYDMFLKDDVNGKTFLDQEIYNPAACYSLPRKGQASAGYHIGPIPSEDIITLSKDNLVNPKQIKVQRSASKNFFNTVIYQFDEDVLTTNFLSGTLTTNATSQTQIPVGNKVMVIPSKGIRSLLQGDSISAIAANRRLNRYAFGAEFFKGIQVNFRVGFALEIGDILIFDSTGLSVTDTKTGTRNSTIKLYEVVNKNLDYKTGKVDIDLVDTNFSAAARYGLVGPSSTIKAGISTTKFIIQSSFASQFVDNEYLKWNRYTNAPVKVHNADFSILGHSTIKSFAGNQITLASALAFTPAAGQIMELDDYTRQTDQIKIRDCFMKDSAFGDGKQQYQQL